eukprot:2024946-Pyramimonas_sp.AAC.2
MSEIQREGMQFIARAREEITRAVRGLDKHKHINKVLICESVPCDDNHNINDDGYTDFPPPTDIRDGRYRANMQTRRGRLPSRAT